MGREEARPDVLVKRGKSLSVAELTARLIEILKMYKEKPVTGEPETTMPRQEQQPVAGTLILKVKQLDVKILRRLTTQYGKPKRFKYLSSLLRH